MEPGRQPALEGVDPKVCLHQQFLTAVLPTRKGAAGCVGCHFSGRQPTQDGSRDHTPSSLWNVPETLLPSTALGPNCLPKGQHLAAVGEGHPWGTMLSWEQVPGKALGLSPPAVPASWSPMSPPVCSGLGLPCDPPLPAESPSCPGLAAGLTLEVSCWRCASQRLVGGQVGLQTSGWSFFIQGLLSGLGICCWERLIFWLLIGPATSGASLPLHPTLLGCLPPRGSFSRQ